MKDKLRYWFDKQMSKGSISMIFMLSVCSLLVILLITGIILVFGLSEEGTLFDVFWDTFATIVNAWMPYSDEGGHGYILLTALAAVIGLLFTSVLIGVVGSAIEDRITQLRKGNSLVLEEDHIVILGFTPGEYTLFDQLIEARENQKHTIVIAEDMERDEMEDYIHDNVTKSKNTTIICRKVDITDQIAMKCLSLDKCSGIIVNTVDDQQTIRCILAVRNALKETDSKIQIVTSVSDDKYLLPSKMRKEEGIIMLQTYDLIARTVAHSCTQPGISSLFSTVFSFEGEEFYMRSFPELVGKNFIEIMNIVDHAIPIGIYRDDRIILDEDEIFKENDELLYFAKHRNSITYTTPIDDYDKDKKAHSYKEHLKVAIIGINDVLDTIMYELPDSVKVVEIANASEELIERYSEMYKSMIITSFDGELNEDSLKDLVIDKDNVVLLNDHTMDDDEGDMEVIMNLIQLRNIRDQYHLRFNITAEMKKEKNRNLVNLDDGTDYIVASDMSSMILCQVSENGRLYRFLKELLSNEGNELYMKLAKQFHASKKPMTIHQLRMSVYQKGYVLIGYQKNGEIIFCDEISNNETIELHDMDLLVVIGAF